MHFSVEVNNFVCWCSNVFGTILDAEHSAANPGGFRGEKSYVQSQNITTISILMFDHNLFKLVNKLFH